MGLIRCPACSKQVSSSAQQCPSCGHSIAGRKTEATTGLSALIVIIGVIITIFLMFTLVDMIDNTPLALGLSLIPTILAFVIASMRKK